MGDFKTVTDIIPIKQGQRWGIPCTVKPIPFTGPFYDSLQKEIVESGAEIPPMEICRHCGKPIPWEGYSWGDKIDIYPNVPVCSCPEAQAEEKARLEAEEARKKEEHERMKAEAFAEKIRKITEDSGMNSKFLERRFDQFTVKESNKDAFKACKTYAAQFEKFLPGPEKETPEKNSLYLYGPMGTGKTHLAASVANELIAKGQPVICMTAREIFTRIRNTFKRDEFTELEIMQTYMEAPLLIIDDLGKETATEWSTSTLFQIINMRYEAMMPTIITTNYSMPDLIGRLTPRGSSDQITAAATVDRLREMCRSYQITGDSWRK